MCFLPSGKFYRQDAHEWAVFSLPFAVSNSEYRTDQVLGQTLQMDSVHKKYQIQVIFYSLKMLTKQTHKT